MTEPLAHELTAAEQDRYEQLGYLIRHDVFGPDEVAAMIDASEALVADLVRDRVSNRLTAGSYVFDPDLLRGVLIKWEGDTDVVHGIEPFAHLSPELERWAHDDRLVHPMRAMVGDPEPMLFTEKLNLKRPRFGGPNPLHQDYPYWRDVTDDPSRVATTIVYLDDSTVDNGCTWVVPGSHRSGMWRTRTDTDVFGQNEVDASAYPDVEPVPVELKAGSTVSFGSLMVHQSTPNTSELDRRALLFSYQPAGGATMVEGLRRVASRT
jgi:ectoine hydroxylase-related dioxygenase (phytanoyl-CoA dioxygenase family)